MNKTIIKNIQSRVLELLPKERQSDRAILLHDSCSELSRLVAGWLEEDKQFTQYFILKGVHVYATKKSHDILAVIDFSNKVYLIDPTIWQFFPQEESILVGEVNSLAEATVVAEDKYGGTWKMREELKNISVKEKEEWLKMVNININS